jgi:hypothetical protein
VTESVRFGVGDHVRVSLESGRWPGAVGWVGIPAQLSRRSPPGDGGAVTPFIASPYRDHAGARLWWIEFDEPLPDRPDTHRVEGRVRAGEVAEASLELEP